MLSLLTLFAAVVICHSLKDGEYTQRQVVVSDKKVPWGLEPGPGSYQQEIRNGKLHEGHNVVLDG